MLNEWLWQKETEREEGGGHRGKKGKKIWKKKWNTLTCCVICISSVQSLSRVRFFVTPWTAPRQASLSIANSRSLLKLMSIESVIPSNHLILYRPLLLLPSIFPSIRVFSNESVLLTPGGQRIGVSASASVLPMNIHTMWFLYILKLYSYYVICIHTKYSYLSIIYHISREKEPTIIPLNNSSDPDSQEPKGKWSERPETQWCLSSQEDRARLQTCFLRRAGC